MCAVKRLKSSKIQRNKIKIPAYISEPIDDSSVVYTSYKDMVDYITNKINNYNNSLKKFGQRIKGKSIERQIVHINYSKLLDGERDIILLKIVEQKTGYTDLEVDGSKNTPVGFNDKLKSKYNCAILYPNIDSIGDKKYNNWLTFVYIDPGKVDSDVINTVKSVLENVLGLKIKNLKKKAANELIRKSIVTKLTAQYVNVKNNNESLKIKGHQVSATIKEIKNFVYDNVSSEDLDVYVNSHDDAIPYVERKITVTLANNQNLRYIHKKTEDEMTVKDVIEQMYNYETNIDMAEFNKMYDDDFILEKVKNAVLDILGNE